MKNSMRVTVVRGVFVRVDSLFVSMALFVMLVANSRFWGVGVRVAARNPVMGVGVSVFFRFLRALESSQSREVSLGSNSIARMR